MMTISFQMKKKTIKQLGGLQNIIKALLLYTEMCDNNHNINDNHNRNDKLGADSEGLQPPTNATLSDTSMKRSRSTHLQTIRNNINHSDSKSSALCQSTISNITKTRSQLKNGKNDEENDKNIDTKDSKRDIELQKMAIANVTNTANIIQMKSATVVLSSTSTHGNYKENLSGDHDDINVDGSSSIATLTLTDAGSITSVPHISNFDHRYTMHTTTQRKGKMSRINRKTNNKKKTNHSRKNLSPSLHHSPTNMVRQATYRIKNVENNTFTLNVYPRNSLYHSILHRSHKQLDIADALYYFHYSTPFFIIVGLLFAWCFAMVSTEFILITFFFNENLYDTIATIITIKYIGFSVCCIFLIGSTLSLDSQLFWMQMKTFGIWYKIFNVTIYCITSEMLRNQKRAQVTGADGDINISTGLYCTIYLMSVVLACINTGCLDAYKAPQYFKLGCGCVMVACAIVEYIQLYFATCFDHDIEANIFGHSLSFRYLALNGCVNLTCFWIYNLYMWIRYPNLAANIVESPIVVWFMD